MSTVAGVAHAGEAAAEKASDVTIREVFFASDLSPRSDRAFDHARLLAERFRARMTVFHAIERSELQAVATADVSAEVWRRFAEEAREHLALGTKTLTVAHEVLVDPNPSARRALLALVASRRPDLVVMATHGREGLSHLLLGSVTEAVIRHGDCPVLCVREPDHGTALPYRRILVPTDLSGPSRRAFRMAAHLARAFESDVIGVHVGAPRPDARLLGTAHWVEFEAPDQNRVQEFMEPAFSGLRFSTRVRQGEPWREIVAAALEERADLVVLSTHGAGSLAKRLLGTHAERVARHAPCPVLVIP
jgi:nucleotide-binding universal stress UspA family protein